MISTLRGVLTEKNPPNIILEVGGVGYEVSVPMTTFYQLPELNQATFLYTHFAVREDAQTLYGFIDTLSREVFRLLVKINGVGPKLALSILSGMDCSTFHRTIQEKALAKLVKLPGVGKKTAERLLIELADPLDKLLGQPLEGKSQASILPDSIIEDAISALVALGYKQHDAARVVKKFPAEVNQTSENLIKKALQSMVA